MSIASEISRLQTAKSALKTSIENKGVTVPSATTLDGYAALVDQISGGGGGGTTTVTVYPLMSLGSYTIGYVDGSGTPVQTSYGVIDPDLSGSATIVATAGSPITFFAADPMNVTFSNDPTNCTLVFAKSGSAGGRPAVQYNVRTYWVD